MDIKLQVFYDYCTKVGLPEDQFHLAFSIMLKGRASLYYYDKIARRSYGLSTMVQMTRTHFETEERHQKYLTEWRQITLHRIIVRHRDKTLPECLEMLFDTLHTAQRGLSAEYQNEHTLRDQVVNACKGIPECRPALFRPASTFEGLCAELRSAVGQIVRERELNHSAFYGKGTRSHTRKCYICGRPGCYSTNHTDEEQRKAYDQFTEEAYWRFFEGAPDDTGKQQLAISMEP